MSTDTYPRTDEQGRTIWACCVSTIGGPCAHLRPPCPGCGTTIDLDGYCTDPGCRFSGKVPLAPPDHVDITDAAYRRMQDAFYRSDLHDMGEVLTDLYGYLCVHDPGLAESFGRRILDL